MADVAARLDKVEERLGGVEAEVKDLRGEVGTLRGEVGTLGGKVGTLGGEVATLRGEVGVLRGEVQALRVLGEKTAGDVKLVAEVQTHHGERLDRHERMLGQIVTALEPLKALPTAVQQIAQDVGTLKDFIQRVIPQHEARLSVLENRVGLGESHGAS